MPLPCLCRRRKKPDFLDAFAQVLDQLRESFLGRLVRALPMWCLHEREHRRERRFPRCDFDERDACAWSGVGIALVVADEVLRAQWNILDWAGTPTDSIKSERERDDTHACNHDMDRVYAKQH